MLVAELYGISEYLHWESSRDAARVLGEVGGLQGVREEAARAGKQGHGDGLQRPLKPEGSSVRRLRGHHDGEVGELKELLTRLDSVFKCDAITELPSDFEQFFVTMQRQRNESMQEDTANFERQLRRLAGHGVTLPDKVVGWFYLRRAGLTQSQRQMIMTTLTTEQLSLESVRKGVNFVIGQDTTPEGGNAQPPRSPSMPWRPRTLCLTP